MVSRAPEDPCWSWSLLVNCGEIVGMIWRTERHSMNYWPAALKTQIQTHRHKHTAQTHRYKHSTNTQIQTHRHKHTAQTHRYKHTQTRASQKLPTPICEQVALLLTNASHVWKSIMLLKQKIYVTPVIVLSPCLNSTFMISSPCFLFNYRMKYLNY